MNLGSVSVRRSGLNTLRSAIHPNYGLAWTDGQCVYLAPVNIVDDRVENDNSVKLGQFQHVRSLHWSGDMSAGFCYLCVRHKTTVSLWKVEGQPSDLGCRQVRKINASPIEQGCLWNPGRDILCLLLRDQCSFYFRHTQNKGSFVLPPIESGRINCGCWSDDGQKLIVGVGSIVLIYQWIEIDKSISEYDIVAWKIPGVDGTISCLLPAGDHQVLCTAELPLDSLCCASHDMFQVPDVDGSLKETSDTNSVVDTMLRPNGTGDSLRGCSLLNLDRKESSTHDSSQLIVFEMTERGRQPYKMAAVNLSGMLSVHLLHYNRYTNTILVGSNTQPLLQMFILSEMTPAKLYSITLDASERPLGLCGVASQTDRYSGGVLLMVGRASTTNDSAFMSASLTADYQVTVCYKPLITEPLVTTHQPHRSNLNGQIRVSLPPPKPRRETDDTHISYEAQFKALPSLETLVLPCGVSTSKSNSIALIDTGSESDELQVDTVSFADQAPRFVSDVTSPDQTPRFGTDVTSCAEAKASSSVEHHMFDSDFSSGASVLSDGEEVTGQIAILEDQMRMQTDRITALQKRIEQIQHLLDDSCNIPEKVYSPITQPNLVHLVLRKGEGEGEGEGEGVRKTFLLDCGRLQLEQVKLAFQLATVELIIDGNPCVLGCNTDGYIPMRMHPDTTMYISGTSQC